MSNLYRFDEAYRDLADVNNILQKELQELKHGGDGTSGGMEARVAKLEADVGHLVKQVDKIDARTEQMPSKLATLEERMAHLPSKGFIVGVVITAMTAMVALLTILSKIGALAAG